MRVHVCRHAEAAPGDPDELRELTETGRAQARELARLLDGSPSRPTLVLTSPLLRARQTAAVIGEELELPVLVDSRLAPGATAATLRAAIVGLVGPVATVGHQPDCSEIAVALTGRDPGFSVGSAVELEVELDRDAGITP
jgi:phosphohistidine phosphatase